MLAEIFMLRLEAAVRLMDKTLPSSTSLFVPFRPEPQFAPKEIWETPAGGKMEEPYPPLVETQRRNNSDRPTRNT
jgi:hypothetical protein